jgi:hypothetical protein
MRCNEQMRYLLVPLLAASALLWSPPAGADNFLTQSERVLCAVTPDESLVGAGPDAVVCQGDFVQAPEVGAGAVTTGDGTFHWEVGNLGVFNTTTEMKYGTTYHHGNWRIYHDATGTQFTHVLTGNGMFVSIEDVYAF